MAACISYKPFHAILNAVLARLQASKQNSDKQPRDKIADSLAVSSVVVGRHTRTTIFCGSSEDNSDFDYRFLLLFFNSRHITYIIVLETFIDVECAKALGRIILKLYEDQHGPNQYIQ